jgi:hypothetical protein
MATYVYDKERGIMVDKATREPMVDPNAPFVPATPMAIHDIPPYLSPVTGEYISGKRAKAEDLKRHDCVDANEIRPPRKLEFKNKAFAKKRGLEAFLREDAR